MKPSVGGFTILRYGNIGNYGIFTKYFQIDLFGVQVQIELRDKTTNVVQAPMIINSETYKPPTGFEIYSIAITLTGSLKDEILTNEVLYC